MEQIGQALPRLEAVESQPYTALRQVVAATLRESPALRTMAEVVRADPRIFDEIAAFGTRRPDFRATYDPPGRAVAPMLAGLAHAAPDLYDAAFEAHFDGLSQRVLERLEDDTAEIGYSYWPDICIGTGPQAQIFASALLEDKPELSGQLLLLDQNSCVGGTFRDSDAMDFRGNSRNRPQTDEPPIPGTKGNINPLVPGVMTPADYSAETYVPVVSLFRRPVTANHALHGMPIGLNLRLVAIVPDATEQAHPDFPGRLTAIARHEVTGKTYALRTDSLIGAIGGGEPTFATFSEATQKLIAAERQLLNDPEAPRMPLIMTHADLYAHKGSTLFPFNNIKDVAVIGAKDGGCTAVGTFLGYEPRADGSVMQIDRIKTLDWYGQPATDDLRYAQSSRFRYIQLALEFARRANPERDYRITPDDTRVDAITVNPDSTKAIIGPKQYDLVVIPTGFANDGEQWALDLLREPLRYDDVAVQVAIKDPAKYSLSPGDTITLPKGFNLEQIQILNVNPDDLDIFYTVAITDTQGKVTIGSLGADSTQKTSLGDYCNLEKFGGSPASEVLQTASQKVEVMQTADFCALSESDQKAFLAKQPVFFPGDVMAGGGLSDGYGYKVIKCSGESVELEELVFNNVTNRVQVASIIELDYDELLNSIRYSETDGLLIVNPAIAEPDSDTYVDSISSLSVITELEAFADQNAIIVLPPNTTSDIFYAILYRNDDQSIGYGLIFNDEERTWTNRVGSVPKLVEILSENDSVKIILPKPAERPPEKEAEPAVQLGGLSGEAFYALSDEQKRQRLQPDTVIYFGSTLTGSAFIVNEVNTDGFVILNGLDYNAETGFSDINMSTLKSIKLNDLAESIRNQGAIINNPALLAKNAELCRQITTTAKNVNADLEQLAAQNAVLVDTTIGNYINLYSFVLEQDGTVGYSFKNDNNFFGQDRLNTTVPSRNFASLKQSISATGANAIFKIIIPPQPVTNTVSVQPAKQPQAPTKRTGFTVITAPDSDKPIAKQLNGAPVYLIGSAANLPIDRDVTRLIPNIPDNSQSTFVSQPRVELTAGRIALGRRTPPLNDRQPPLETKGQLNPSQLDEQQQPTRVSLKLHKPDKRGPIRNLEPDQALRLGIGMQAREQGMYFDNFNTLSDSDIWSPTVSIKRNPKDKTLLSVIAYASTLQGRLPDETLTVLLQNKLVTGALDQMLKAPGVTAIELRLPFDIRGLQVGAIQIIPKTNVKPRPFLPRFPGRSRKTN